MDRRMKGGALFSAFVFLMLGYAGGVTAWTGNLPVGPGLWLTAAAPAQGAQSETAPASSPLAADPKTAGMEAYEKNDLKKAAQLLREAAALDPNDMEVARRLGFALKETGNYEEALAVLERVVAAVPDDYYHWWWLSDTQRLLGRYAESLKSMERSARLASADLREELQEYVDYTARLAATDKSWENAAVHMDFAERHRANRRVRRQIAEMMTALSLAPEVAPDDREGLGRRAHICQQLGIQHIYIEEPEVAVDWFSEAAKLSEMGAFPGDRLQALKEWAGALWAMARQQLEQADSLLEQASALYATALGLALEIKEIPQERQTRALLLRTRARLTAFDDPDFVALRERNFMEVPRKGPVNEFSVAEAVAVEAELRLVEGDFAGARILLEMAMPYFEESTYLTDYHRFTELQLQLAQAWLRLSQPAAASESIEKARKKAEEARAFIDYDAFNRGQGALLLRRMACAGVRALAAAGSSGDMLLTAAEQGVERAAYYRMRGVLADDASRRDIAAEADVIRMRLPMLEQRLRDAEERGDAPEAERLRARVARDQDRLAWLDGIPDGNLSLLRDYRPAPVLGGDRFRKCLAGNTAVLHLLSDEYGTVAVITGKEASVAMECVLTDSEAARLAEQIRKGGDAASKALERLRTVLLAPIVERLRQLPADFLVVCADIGISGLPLEVLLGSADSGGPAIRTTRLTYASQLDAVPAVSGQLSSIAVDATAANAPEFSDLLRIWKDAQRTVTDTPAPGSGLLLRVVLNQLPPDPLYCRLRFGSDAPPAELTVSQLLRDKPWQTGEILMAWDAADAAQSRLRPELAMLLWEVARLSGASALLMPAWAQDPQCAAAFFAALAQHLDAGSFIEAVGRAREDMRQSRPEDPGWMAFTCWGTAGLPRPAEEPTANPSVPEAESAGNGGEPSAVSP